MGRNIISDIRPQTIATGTASLVPEVISRKGLLLFGDSVRTIQYGVVGPAGALVVLDITFHGLVFHLSLQTQSFPVGSAVTEPFGCRNYIYGFAVLRDGLALPFHHYQREL